MEISTNERVGQRQSSRRAVNHVLRGKDSFSFPNVYVIGITDFIMKGVPENDEMINQYALINKKDLGIPLCDRLTYVTVELPKLKKTVSELETPTDFLLYAIRNIGEMKEVPVEYKGKGLDKLFELCKFASMTLEEQRQYLAEFMAEVDEKSRMRTAINTGREGAKREDARNLKSLGVSPDIIAKATGLDMETVEAL